MSVIQLYEDEMPVGQVSIVQMCPTKYLSTMSVNQMPASQMSFNQMSVDQISNVC
jgi:hypothetical protein